MIPNLDRFSRPGPSEKYRVRLVTLEPECEVCGQAANQKFLRHWNDKQVCTTCIRELTADVQEGDLIL